MTILQFTPGPWEISLGYVRAAKDGTKIANLSDGMDFEATWTDAEQTANARLIAAAPDLVARVRRRLTMCAATHAAGETCLDCAADRAALAKATGR